MAYLENQSSEELLRERCELTEELGGIAIEMYALAKKRHDILGQIDMLVEAIKHALVRETQEKKSTRQKRKENR